MIIGIGTDIVEVERIRRAAGRRTGFLDRVFSRHEQEICEDSPRPWESYAGRFAAKEAFLKVCGAGIFSCDLRTIEIHRNEQGKPFFVLSGNTVDLTRKLGICQMHLSIAHERSMALAVAIGEGTLCD